MRGSRSRVSLRREERELARARRARIKHSPRRRADARSNGMIGRFRVPAYLQNAFLRVSRKQWIIAGVILFLAILIPVLVTILRVPKAQDSSFYASEKLVVGVVNSGNSFAKTAEDGSLCGFEPDFISEALSRIFPDKPVEFAEISSQEASYLLKSGEINVALGMFSSGVLKTQGLGVSDGYYTDPLCVYTSAANAPKGVNVLKGGKIYLMSTETKASELSRALLAMNLDLDANNFVACSSYPDAAAAVISGRARGVVAPKQKAAEFGGELTQVGGEIGKTVYRVAIWDKSEALLSLLSRTIAKMQRDGSMAELLQKWQLG